MARHQDPAIFSNFFTEKIFVSKDHRFFLIVGVIIGLFTAYTLLPETKSALFGAILGVVLTLIIGYLQKSCEQFKKQTSMGKLLGPIYYKGAKCTVFVTEYWRDINKGNRVYASYYLQDC